MASDVTLVVGAVAAVERDFSVVVVVATVTEVFSVELDVGGIEVVVVIATILSEVSDVRSRLGFRRGFPPTIMGFDFSF